MSDNTENKMGTMPVGRLLVQISLPMMISMLVQALYNIVDSIFVAQISENALTAVSLAFPIQNLMISTAVGTGVGVNALLSRRLGEQNEKGVTDSALNGIFLYTVRPFGTTQKTKTDPLVQRRHWPVHPGQSQSDRSLASNPRCSLPCNHPGYPDQHDSVQRSPSAQAAGVFLNTAFHYSTDRHSCPDHPTESAWIAMFHPA